MRFLQVVTLLGVGVLLGAALPTKAIPAPKWDGKDHSEILKDLVLNYKYNDDAPVGSTLERYVFFLTPCVPYLYRSTLVRRQPLEFQQKFCFLIMTILSPDPSLYRTTSLGPGHTCTFFGGKFGFRYAKKMRAELPLSRIRFRGSALAEPAW